MREDKEELYYHLAEAEHGDEIDQVRHLKIAQKVVEKGNSEDRWLVNYYKKEFGIEYED